MLDDVLSGKPYLRLIRRMTVAEFLGTDQPAAVKRKLQSILDERNTPSPEFRPRNDEMAPKQNSLPRSKR